jgi:hypothetical protein
MAALRHAKTLNILAIVCGIWFLLSSWMWFYLANVFFSFPAGILGLICWYFGKNDESSKALNRLALRIIIAGIIVAILSFTYFYFQG